MREVMRLFCDVGVIVIVVWSGSGCSVVRDSDRGWS